MIKVRVEEPRGGMVQVRISSGSFTSNLALAGSLSFRELEVDDFLELIGVGAVQIWRRAVEAGSTETLEDVLEVDDRREFPDEA